MHVRNLLQYLIVIAPEVLQLPQMVQPTYLLDPVAREVEGGELGVLLQPADDLDAVVGEVELVQLLEAVEALYRYNAVALEAQEAVEEIRDTGWMKIVRILNRISNSLPKLWTARQVVDLGNFVLADVKLFEVLQPFQVLDSADPVVA